MEKTTKTYITLPDGMGAYFVVRALQTEFRDVDYSKANDDTVIISCKTPLFPKEKETPPSESTLN